MQTLWVLLMGEAAFRASKEPVKSSAPHSSDPSPLAAGLKAGAVAQDIEAAHHTRGPDSQGVGGSRACSSYQCRRDHSLMSSGPIRPPRSRTLRFLQPFSWNTLQPLFLLGEKCCWHNRPHLRHPRVGKAYGATAPEFHPAEAPWLTLLPWKTHFV